MERPFLLEHKTCGTIVETRGPITDIMNRPLKRADRIISSYPIAAMAITAASGLRTAAGKQTGV